MRQHPSKDIIGAKSERLKGKRVVLCVTGSVAAIRSIDIARELMREAAEVYAVMSEEAQKIIHPNLMEWATGNPVVTELTGKIEHVALAGEHADKADLVLVAPATANTISKIAAGIDDTPVTSIASTALGSETPILIVPAMHISMYKNPFIKESIQKLKAHDITFIEPKIEDDKAKIASIIEIVESVRAKISEINYFHGKRFLITAGPTIEYIDEVRVITNKSSGKMGLAIAKEAQMRNAKVTLIYGLGSKEPPSNLKVLHVETTEEMRQAVLDELKNFEYDVVVSAAAISDWTLTKQYKGKMPTENISSLKIKLKPTPKIIDEIKETSPKSLLVIFKAEFDVSEDELVESAYNRLRKSNADLVVANDISRRDAGFRTDTNEVYIVDKEKKVIHIPLSSKRSIAGKILEVIRIKLD
ncbi:bifunctional phosphopantothenoylcysteine decarboxylase/phosphopantothenate--cysteine ligase CoaBC [Candidatus Bathyarchaeota archaeon]|nr:bifunctional phosphopantothenoylcysteine decarboxylase/phosphopantothenate--cysteine ligase CoaBC [Candidatus Bathyarchaeota archaeon]